MFRFRAAHAPRAAALSAVLFMAVPVGAQEYDLLVRGGRVVDGTGAPAFRADVAVQGDRIVRVEPEGIPAEQAEVVIDASGRVQSVDFDRVTLEDGSQYALAHLQSLSSR